MESIVWITSNTEMALLILLDCKCPIKCSSILSGIILLLILSIVSWTWFSPIINILLLYADSIAENGNVLVTAII